MSSIQNYLSKAQQFSEQVSQEEQLEQSKNEIREKAESNIEQVRDRVEELKAGIASDVGAFGFGTAGAVEKAFQYGKYVSEKASKLKEGVNALRSGIDDTEIGKTINQKISSLISPDSALGRHLQTVGNQVEKLKSLSQVNPKARTREIMENVDQRFNSLSDKGKDDFVKAVNEKQLKDPFGNPDGNLESAIQHDELLKQVEGVSGNLKKGLIGGTGPGAPLTGDLEPFEGDIGKLPESIGTAIQDKVPIIERANPLQDLGGRKIRIGDGGGAAEAEAEAADPRSLLKPGERLLADVTRTPQAISKAIQDTVPIEAPSVSGAPDAEPVETPSGQAPSEKFTEGQQAAEQENIQQEQVASQKEQVAEQQEKKVEKEEPGDEGEGEEEEKAAVEEGGEEGVGEGILGALGPVGDVLAAGSAIFGLVHAEIAKKQEAKEQTDLQSYYDSLSQVKAPNLGSLGANVLDGTQMSSAFTNF